LEPKKRKSPIWSLKKGKLAHYEFDDIAVVVVVAVNVAVFDDDVFVVALDDGVDVVVVVVDDMNMHLLLKKVKRFVIGRELQRHKIGLVNGDTSSAI
jgi:hypothetical protein